MCYFHKVKEEDGFDVTMKRKIPSEYQQQLFHCSSVQPLNHARCSKSNDLKASQLQEACWYRICSYNFHKHFSFILLVFSFSVYTAHPLTKSVSPSNSSAPSFRNWKKKELGLEEMVTDNNSPRRNLYWKTLGSNPTT